MQRSDSIVEFATAFAKAQGQMANAVKNRKNPHFKSEYADLASVVDVIRKPLADNGLSVMQPCRVTEFGLEVETFVMHTSGQWVSETMTMPLPNNANSQVLGSAQSYGRRYGLNSMFCLASEEDDDANAVVEAETRQAQYEKDNPPAPVTAERIAELIAEGDVFAKQGREKFLAWWGGVSKAERKEIHVSHVNAWRDMSVAADAANTPEETQGS